MNKGENLKENKLFIVITAFVWMFILFHQNVNAQQNLAQKAYTIFEQACLICHGENGSYRESLIIEHTALIDDGKVIPGNPDSSVLYQRLIETNLAKRMPLAQPPLAPEAIETIRQWIAAGATDWDAAPTPKPGFITNGTIFETIENHVNSLSPRDRAFARYFTLTHLYNAGETTEALNAYRRALSKLINSLSWGREVVNPQPIDVEQTIFYIDLRDYEWDVRNDAWTQIEQAYPYKMTFDAPTQAALLEKLTTLQQEMSCDVPFVNVDWFLATASLPPLYHDILALPKTDRELEAELKVSVTENLLNAPGRRVWRAGFNDSGVSRHNRVVERHTSSYGAYWKSYDFAGSAESQNIFTHPLDFTHDGGEIIFNLPNGLQAYYLVDDNGIRLDAAPISIVRNPAASDPTVRNGLSCIGCHTEGMKTFEDEVRAAVEKATNPPYDKVKALDLYVEKTVMDDLVAEDTERFRTALEKTGGVFGGIEPVQRFHEAFQGPLSAAHAAAAVGLETEMFLQKISQNVSLQNLGLQVLTNDGGNVKRDAWTSNFDDVISALNSPDSVLPRPEPIPGASVHIPDVNLRAAIANALGKAESDVFTVEEMATLTTLRASNRDIKDLTGIEAAINLENFFVFMTEAEAIESTLSDLSPLAGLTKLRSLSIAGKMISDLSPLSGLVNLAELQLVVTNVSDLSPLSGLSNLKSLWFNHAPISDLTPIARLTSLESLKFYYAESPSREGLSPSLEPLKGLSRLKKLAAARSRISDISPLAELVNLEEVDLFDGSISDILPLAPLYKLRRLNMIRNEVSDVSPLASLHDLEWLHLAHNRISDISPLGSLPKNPKIIWYENPGFPVGGPKIEGPWLWAKVPGPHLDDSTDFLAQASGGSVTEFQIATYGAADGESVGESTWTPHKISSPSGENNIGEMTETLGWTTNEKTYDCILYGSIKLNSPVEQQTKLFVGASDNVRVWINGDLVHKKFGRAWWEPYTINYQHIIPVTLNKGVNVLLVAIDNRSPNWNGFFGFETGTEYTVPSVGYAISETYILIGDTFTLYFNAENITDLAGWQTDIVYDPNVLEAVEVTEGDFLKSEGGGTFFQGGTIDNIAGKITRLFSARISESGVNGTGTLLSVTFKAKAGGETQVTLENFEFISTSGAIIPTVPPNITITVGEYPAWDVNQDGRVSIQDLVLVAKDLGSGTPANLRTDVNRDGVINVQDLILVANHFGESTDSAASPLLAIDNKELMPVMVQAWIDQAQAENDGSLVFQQGIENLEKLLASLIPEKTALLANYPNPFNPDTWIPYHLAKPAEVTLHIYAVNGVLVRTLVLGHQAAGIYQNRSRAAYWDGRNAQGESVASGVYFYTLTAGDFSATRKMLIMK